jgi:hypothetical protein
MKKSISVNKKSRGRPKKKGGVYPVSAVRLPPDLGDAVDQWAKSQADAPTRSEAIRRLVEIGLGKAQPPKPTLRSAAPSNALRAAELAARAIDGVIPLGTPPEERKVRRRKLLEGPSSIRDVRRDKPTRGQA